MSDKIGECYNCLIGWPDAASFPTTPIRTLSDANPIVFGPFKIGDIISISGSRQDGSTTMALYVEAGATSSIAAAITGANRTFILQLSGPGPQLWRVQYENERYIAVRRAVAAACDVNVWRVGNVRQRSFAIPK